MEKIEEGKRLNLEVALTFGPGLGPVRLVPVVD
jgi:hypothetical protein